MFGFCVTLCDCVFSLRSWGIIFLSVGKVLCFCGDKNSGLIFCREGPGLAGIGEIFPHGSEEGMTDVPFSTKAPFGLGSLAATYSVTPTRRYRRSILDARWERYFRLEI